MLDIGFDFKLHMYCGWCLLNVCINKAVEHMFILNYASKFMTKAYNSRK